MDRARATSADRLRERSDPSRSRVLRCAVESRTLEIGLSVGFFGTNLEWVKGVQPPPSKIPGATQYDIVTRDWRAPTALPPRTIDRALCASVPPTRAAAWARRVAGAS